MRASAFVVALVALCVVTTAAFELTLNVDEHNIGSVLCSLCEDAVAEAEAGLSANATAEAVEKAIGDVCKIIPDAKIKDECLANLHLVAGALNSTDESIWVKYSTRAVCAVLELCTIECCATPYTPEQIHLAAGADGTEMVVTWTTLVVPEDPVVVWGENLTALTNTANATTTTYTKGGWIGMVHTAVMTGLKPSTRYYYKVGNTKGDTYWDKPNWSQPVDLNFVTQPVDGSLPVSVAMVADIGATDMSDRTVARLTNLVADGAVDFTFVGGDLSYADGYQTLWDAALRKYEPFAAYAPMQVCVGNHEDFLDFTPYMGRFNMPNMDKGWMYYAFTYGGVRFLALDTEDALGTGLAPGLYPGKPQYDWFVAELEAAAENRAEVPWIVILTHRPLYCASSSTDCQKLAPIYRKDIEDLIHKYGVDLVVSGHRHNYQRTYPVYKEEVTGMSYHNPNGTTYIVNGSAGDKEHLQTGFSNPPPAWSAVREIEYGYSILTAHSATELEFTFYRAFDNSVLDTFTITKD